MCHENECLSEQNDFSTVNRQKFRKILGFVIFFFIVGSY